MRTSVQVDDDLLAEAMRRFGGETESDAVESAMRAAIRIRSQAAILELRGIGWDGDLEEMRLDKPRPTIG